MSRITLALLAFMAVPAFASAQSDTSTRRRDTTRAPQPQDTVRRTQAEARGEIDLTRATRFRAELPNYGFSSYQGIELQQALTRAGCDVGTADGIVGERTRRGIDCFRRQQNLSDADLETLLTALNVSFAKPAEPVVAPEPPRREPVLPPVFRPDSNYRPDVRARRDSVRRDSLRRDSTAKRDTTKRDTTARRDTIRP